MEEKTKENAQCKIEDSKECQAYIGVKIVKAVKMDKSRFMSLEGKKNPEENCEGYMVVYPDGYKSWSPKSVFENAYRLVSDDEKLITKNH
jgi:hypothetical protein